MTTLKYPINDQDPSSELTPQVSLPLADGWQEAEIPDTKLAAMKYKGKDTFSPNLLLVILEDSAESSLAIASQGVAGYIKTLNNPTVLTNEIGKIGEREWHIAEFIYRHKTVGDIIQMIATTVEKANNITYVYRFTGTALSVEAKTDFIEIRKMLATASIADKVK